MLPQQSDVGPLAVSNSPRQSAVDRDCLRDHGGCRRRLVLRDQGVRRDADGASRRHRSRGTTSARRGGARHHLASTHCSHRRRARRRADGPVVPRNRTAAGHRRGRGWTAAGPVAPGRDLAGRLSLRARPGRRPLSWDSRPARRGVLHVPRRGRAESGPHARAGPRHRGHVTRQHHRPVRARQRPRLVPLSEILERGCSLHELCAVHRHRHVDYGVSGYSRAFCRTLASSRPTSASSLSPARLWTM